VDIQTDKTYVLHDRLLRFDHLALVEIDEHCCNTLETNRPHWKGRVHRTDLKQFDATPYRGVDLLAAGLPCPPFSVAGKQLGDKDERNLFPEALRIIDECQPRAIMIENVRGILDAVFNDFRSGLKGALEARGYTADLTCSTRPISACRSFGHASSSSPSASSFGSTSRGREAAGESRELSALFCIP
jgi:site-specific DNA-cytosine methylase